jgi:hypothetical protein
MLPPAGLILNSILLNPQRLEQFELGVEYELSDFGQPPAGLAGTRISFQPHAGA